MALNKETHFNVSSFTLLFDCIHCRLITHFHFIYQMFTWSSLIFFFSQPHQPLQEEKKKNAPVVDHRSVDDLLTFINGQRMEEERLGGKSKAQKKARQKQKKVCLAHPFFFGSTSCINWMLAQF